MYNCVVVRIHEIALKGKNMNIFINQLVRNIRACLKRNGVEFKEVLKPWKKIVILTDDPCDCLRDVPGIASYSRGVETGMDMAKMKEVSLKLYSEGTFRVDCKRGDKRFPLTSMDVERELGAYVCENAGAKVSLKEAEVTIGVELFNDRAYLYSEKIYTLGGLPVGTAGRVCLLLEDESSLVAGFLMMKRGCSLAVIKKCDVDFSCLERFSCGWDLLVFDDFPEWCDVFVVNDTVGNLRDFDKERLVLRPLLGLDGSEIEELKKFVTTNK